MSKAPGLTKPMGQGCLSSPRPGWQVGKSLSSSGPVTGWLCGLGQGPPPPRGPWLQNTLKTFNHQQKWTSCVAVRNTDLESDRLDSTPLPDCEPLGTLGSLCLSFPNYEMAPHPLRHSRPAAIAQTCPITPPHFPHTVPTLCSLHPIPSPQIKLSSAHTPSSRKSSPVFWFFPLQTLGWSPLTRGPPYVMTRAPWHCQTPLTQTE